MRRFSTLPHKASTLSHKPARLLPLALLLVAGLLLAAPRSQGATYSWSGSGATGNWSESANWGYVGVPVSGDTVIFSGGQPRLTNTNNISSLSLSQIRFVGPSGGYAIWGNSFTIGSGGIEATNTAGGNTINNAIILGASPVTVNVGSGVSLTLAGVLSGSGGLTKTGAGTLTFSGTSGNQYSGVTRVNEGQLDLNKTPGVGAFSWTGLVIGDGTGTDTVRCLQSHQIWADGKPVTINSSGVLNLNGFEDTAIPLTLDGGQITTGAGSVWLADVVAVLPEATTATISGNAYLYRSVVITNAGHSSTYDLTINAIISARQRHHQDRQRRGALERSEHLHRPGHDQSGHALLLECRRFGQ